MSTHKSIFAILKQDHEDISMLLRQVQQSAAPGSGRALVTKLRRELLSHMKAEEEVLYDRLARIDSAKSEVRESLQEHNQIERLLDQLDVAFSGKRDWNSTINELKNSIERHVEEEESDIFALARKFIDEEQAQKLGQAFQNEKNQALAQLIGPSGKA